MMIIVGCADIVFIAFKSLWILGKSVARKFENKMQIVASEINATNTNKRN